LSKVAFLSGEDITDCFRIGWKSPELSERLTMLVIVGTSMNEHCFRRQVGIGSESDCLLGQTRRIFEPVRAAKYGSHSETERPTYLQKIFKYLVSFRLSYRFAEYMGLHFGLPVLLLNVRI